MTRYLLSIIALSTTAAVASTPIDETVDAGAAERIDVENVIGSVTVTGSDDDVVRVTGSLSDSASGLDVRRQGSRIVVHVMYPDNLGRGRNRDEGTILVISAPRSLDVDVETVSANMTLEDMHGEQDLSSVSGSIQTMLYAAEVRAETVSGSIGIEGGDESSRTYAASVSGRVELEAVGGEVNSETVSGRLSLRSDELVRAELNSVSGDIEVDARLASDGRLRMVTTSGRISAQLNDSPPGRYDISSFSGTVDVCFGPPPERVRFGPPSARLQFEDPDADIQIVANSMSGRIEICR